jgi:hypothetical protein
MRHQTTRPHVVLVRRGLTAAGLVGALACAATAGAAPVAATNSHAAPVAATIGTATNSHAAPVAATLGTATSPAATSSAIAATRSRTSRSAAGEAIDRRTAGDAGLRRSDFPAGWTSSPAPAQSTSSACPAVTAAKAAVSARANSREFRLDGSATADSSVYVYPDTATSVHAFAQLTSHGTTACLVRVLRDSLAFQLAAQGATLDSVTSHVLTIAPVGDQHLAHLVTIRLSAGATRVTAYADVIFVRVGRAVASFSLGGVGQIFDAGLEAKLAKAVVGRLATGLGQR